MSDELKITKEAVLNAAKECPDAADVLKKLFPKIFTAEIDYKEVEADHIIRALNEYSGYRETNTPRAQYMARERYVMARIFYHGIRTDVVDEIEDLGPRKLYRKYKDLPKS